MIDKIVLTLGFVWAVPIVLFAAAYWTECRAERKERRHGPY